MPELLTISVLAVNIIVLVTSLSTNLPQLAQITEPVDHSECPAWDSTTNLLYFVDIHSGRVFDYTLATGKTHFIKLSGQVSPVIPDKKKNTFIVGLNRSVQAIEWDGHGQLKSQRLLAVVQDDQPRSRFNDGKADAKGRLWIGTMGYETKSGILTPNEGYLFKITKDSVSKPTPVFRANLSNGMAWDRANEKFFYIDTPTLQIAQFDFNLEKGEISNRKAVFDFKKNNVGGAPDGMTIDKDDNLWIASFGGGAVLKVNPRDGTLLQRIAIPATQVTSVAWGGLNLDILFVTTSRYSLNERERLQQPAAGSVFAVTNLGTAGVPMHKTDII